MIGNSRRLRIAFFNPVFAHYRAGLLRELERTTVCEYALFADAADAAHGIEALALSHDPRFTEARCTQLLRLTWQHGTLRETIFGQHDVYILLGNPEWVTSWLGAMFARLRGRRVLFWTHGWTRRDSFLKRLIRNSMLRLANGLLLYGERARDFGMGYGFAPESLYVMYNSLDFDRQRAIAQRLSYEDRRAQRQRLFEDIDVPIVIASARLTAAKRLDLLIKALSALRRRGKQINAIFVGDGPERDRLQALADEQKVTAAFVGACYDEVELARLFSCANVTVSPGNIGLTAMHSLTYGVPVISHDDPNAQGPEWEAIVPGINGALFKKDCVESLASKIDELTPSAWLDAGTRERCIRTIAARYHPNKQHSVIESAALGLAAAPSYSGRETEPRVVDQQFR